ncbi:hypothetical protein BCEP4_1250044 [Burkholderia cepacia]|nr:hypothetical protein BCEP4_1250044 [Burkholderia cepacia]
MACVMHANPHAGSPHLMKVNRSFHSTQIKDRLTLGISPSTLRAAGWSSLAARRAHNPKVVGSNPTPATNTEARFAKASGLFAFRMHCCVCTAWQASQTNRGTFSRRHHLRHAIASCPIAAAPRQTLRRIPNLLQHPDFRNDSNDRGTRRAFRDYRHGERCRHRHRAREAALCQPRHRQHRERSGTAPG